MLKRKEFDELFKKLVSNPWEYMERKSLDSTRSLYYDNLKIYSVSLLNLAFNELLTDKDQKTLPSLQRIRWQVGNIIENKRSKTKPKIMRQNRRVTRLFKRLMRQTRYIIDTHGNDRDRLRECGEKYQRIRRKLRKRLGNAR